MQTQVQNKHIIRKSSERGMADFGWLKAKHTFSFGEYYDPENMGFSALRVINEDRVAGGRGFGTHPHSDMEIITYIISGALKHQDSMKNSAVILPGEVQTMTAGTGVSHSEFNPSEKEETHLLQIWILPKEKNLTPRYGQKSFEEDLSKKDVVLVVSGDGRDGSIKINQDASIYVSRMDQGKKINFANRLNRRAWIQIIKGEVTIDDQKLEAGDAMAIREPADLSIFADKKSEVMLFDLP